jgi:hypothetical protein
MGFSKCDAKNGPMHAKTKAKSLKIESLNSFASRVESFF